MEKTTKQITTVFAGVALIMSLGLASCKKGSTGPAGTNGTNGVANIQTSILTTTNSSWVFDNTYNSYTATLNYSAITQTVIDKGTVQVFMSDSLGTEFAALPFSIYNLQYNYNYKVGQIFLEETLANGTVPTNPGSKRFKVVVIPPASKSSNPNSSNSEIQYSEQLFKIEG